MNESAALLRVSVVIPVYNDASGIRNCLEALKRQTYPASLFEVVVIDNGSSPTLHIANNHPFSVIKAECLTPGSYAARNAGAAIATGDILAFTDADCLPDDKWIEAGVRCLLAGSSPHFVGGEVHICAPTARTGAGIYQHATGFSQKTNIERKGFSATANLFCLRSQFSMIGPFDERLMSAGDREWAWRAGGHGLEVKYAPDAIVSTPPRTSLRAAIRQTRRVAAGRFHLRTHGLDWAGPEALRPHRGAVAALAWIAGRAELSWWERAKVLNAALILKGAAVVETIRLRLGGDAERR